MKAKKAIQQKMQSVKIHEVMVNQCLEELFIISCHFLTASSQNGSVGSDLEQ